jgi:hypothetical protein
MQRPSIMPVHNRDSLNWSLAPSKPLREALTHSNDFEIAKKIRPGTLKRGRKGMSIDSFHSNLHIQSPTQLQAITSNAALDIISHLTCAHAISYPMFILQSNPPRSYPVCSQHRSSSSFSPRHNHCFPLYSNLESDGDNSSCQYHR